MDIIDPSTIHILEKFFIVSKGKCPVNLHFSVPGNIIGTFIAAITHQASTQQEYTKPITPSLTPNPNPKPYPKRFEQLTSC